MRHWSLSFRHFTRLALFFAQPRPRTGRGARVWPYLVIIGHVVPREVQLF